MKSLRAPNKAFTLVELLTVIAIIGVLAALAVVGLARAREASRAAACVSQLRQLAAACQLYSGENKGVIIPICTGTSTSDAKTWRLYLEPYVGTDPKAFNCPGDPDAAVADPFARGRRPGTYGINKSSGLHEYFGANGQKRVGQIISPANTLFMSDIALVTNPGASPSQWTSADLASSASYGYARLPNDPSFSGGDPWNVFPRHNGKANVAFYDGHVASVDVAKDLIAHPPGAPLCIYDNN
jgi:prepilin-type N-terminal cleavage/methylation domain-containing protein/prepilin-type processing-associated H-X9-DG protein